MDTLEGNAEVGKQTQQQPVEEKPVTLSIEQREYLENHPELLPNPQAMKEWLGSRDASHIEYNFASPQKLSYAHGSYSDIVRDGIVLRTVPFLWQVDTETNQGWAFFWADQFYGQLRRQPIWPWRRVKRQTVITGFRKGGVWTDNTIGAGFKAKFEENAATQVPVKANYSKAELQEFIEESQFTSQIFLLKMHLEKYIKPKMNWGFIAIIIIIVLVAAAAVYLYLNPNILGGMAHMLGLNAGPTS